VAESGGTIAPAEVGSQMRMSQRFEELTRDAKAQGSISIQQLVDRFGSGGHLIAILLLSVPFVQPIPMLGLSTAFGAIIISIAATYALGKPPYVPARFRSKLVSAELLATIGEKGAKVFRWIERYIKPRGRYFHSHSWMRATAALLIVVSRLLLALPLPIPASNTVPTIPIILLALGLMEEDGYFVAAGYVSFALAIALFGTVLLGPIVGFFVAFGDRVL